MREWELEVYQINYINLAILKQLENKNLLLLIKLKRTFTLFFLTKCFYKTLFKFLAKI